MKLLSTWLRAYLPGLAVSDAQLAEDLTLRGIAVDGVFDLGASNGSLFETDITTNRVDAMNHYGVAREAAAIYGLTLPALGIDASGRPAASSSPANAAVQISIEAPDLCGRFTARVLRDVTIRPSTGMVAERFRLLEQKLISNAVDASNYVMLAMGQPTHAFDLDRIAGSIVVRRARKGERLKLLDGTERTLDADDLVVADQVKALGLAGVMGGWDSMITSETKNVLVEAAWFDPAAIRRSARRHGIHTDASHRFERGTDWNAPPVASAMLTQILLEAGGHIDGEFIDIVVPEAKARTAGRQPVAVQVSEVQRLLGTTIDGLGISAETMEQVLKALGCGLAAKGDGAYQVTLPSWRLDLEREIDLIEEVARVYGYNRFANTLPVFAGTVVELPHADSASTLRSVLLAAGLHEAVTTTFCSAAEANLFAPQPAMAVALENPLSAEAGMLRPSLACGLLHAVEDCLNRKSGDVRLFEMGTVFSGSAERVEEKPALGLVATGSMPSSGPHHPARAIDFYDAKGIAESLIETFEHKSVYFDAHFLPAWLHPGRGARCVVDGTTIGYFGQLHPSEAERRKLRQDVLIGEFCLDRLYRLPLRQPRVQELSRFQAVARDFSFLLPATLAWEKIAGALNALGIPELVSYAPRELLGAGKDGQLTQGRKVEQGHASLLLSTLFQAPDRTLRDEQVQLWSQQIVEAIGRLGGRLRI